MFQPMLGMCPNLVLSAEYINERHDYANLILCWGQTVGRYALICSHAFKVEVRFQKGKPVADFFISAHPHVSR